MLGAVVVAHVLNVPESQLVSMFCAQFSFFVIPVATCMMGTFISTLSVFQSVLEQSYMGIKYSLYNAAASLEVGFLLHHC